MSAFLETESPNVTLNDQKMLKQLTQIFVRKVAEQHLRTYWHRHVIHHLGLRRPEHYLTLTKQPHIVFLKHAFSQKVTGKDK